MRKREITSDDQAKMMEIAKAVYEEAFDRADDEGVKELSMVVMAMTYAMAHCIAHVDDADLRVALVNETNNALGEVTAYYAAKFHGAN